MKDEKQFDAVRTMRQIREELNREMAGMSFEKQKRYIRERVALPYSPDRRESSKPSSSAG